MTNKMVDIKKFLSTTEKPMSNEELMVFWKSLTPDEKEYYLNVELK